MAIGLIGLGRMGAAIAQRLAACGESVVGWDIDPAAVAGSAGPAFTAAGDAAAVASATDVVISIVTEDEGVRRLYRGDRGLLAGDVSGKLFIEMSTLRPETTRGLAAEIAQRGGSFVEAPVLGTIPTVRDGKLLALAGGSEDDVAHARPILGHLTRSIVHMGPVGAASAMKLGVNLVMAGYIEAVGEALALGASQGLTHGAMLEVLQQSPTANPWLVSKLPVLLGGDVETTLDLRNLRKDVMSAVSVGAASGVPMPLAGGVVTTLSAAVATGWGREDLATLPRFLQQAMRQTYRYD